MAIDNSTRKSELLALMNFPSRTPAYCRVSILLLATTGLRIGEALALRKIDNATEARALRSHGNKTRRPRNNTRR